MDTNQLPTRSERHKTKENSSQLSAAFVLGTCWILFTLIPESWRSPGTYIVIGIIAIYLSSKLDKFKCWKRGEIETKYRNIYHMYTMCIKYNYYIFYCLYGY
ncbi:hypothetical protein [Priestia aryabhattai]|uniref:hypothetical protein n=1 Tax=Priestia aryabhattai TaxID=412384 RepID=UPI003D273DB5